VDAGLGVLHPGVVLAVPIDRVDYRATVPSSAVPVLNRRVTELSAQAVAAEESRGEAEEKRVNRTMELVTTPDGLMLMKTMASQSLASSTGWVEWPALGNRYRFRTAREVAEIVVEIARKREDASLKAIGDGDADMYS
jgi:hypothetical protein